jgi:hypothetical protein
MGFTPLQRYKGIMSETNVWLVTEEDKKTPQVGDLWVRVSFYGLGGGKEGTYFKVVRVTPTQIVLNPLVGSTKIKLRRKDFTVLGAPTHGMSSYYPLTEARKERLESEKEERRIGDRLHYLLETTKVRDLSSKKQASLLTAMESILEAEEPST